MLHGLGASTFAFRLLQPLLATQLRAIAVDQQGFGCSALPADGDYSLSAQARQLVGLMDQLGIDRATVLGHSLGGAIAMHAAVAYPERIERLILVSSASDVEARRGAFVGRLGRFFLPLVAVFTLHNVRFRRMSLRSAVYDPAHITPELVEQYLRPWHVRGRLRVVGNLLVDRRRDPKLDPSAITQPTLIIWGQADRWLPPSRGERLQRLIPDARLVVVPKAGHLVPEEQPEEVAKAIVAFVKPQPAGTAV